MRSKMTAMVALAAAALLPAACTTTAARNGSAVDINKIAAAAKGNVPPWHAGTPAQALALARRVLAELRFPAGTRPIRLAVLPPLLRDHQPPPGPGWAGVSETLRAPQSPRSVLALLDASPPFSMPAVYGTELPTWSGIALAAPAPGVDAAQVSVGIVPYAGGTALITAYVYAAWLPYRTAAEYIDPANFRSVTAAVHFGPVLPGPATTRTFTNPVIIARLAGLLNASAPEPAEFHAGQSCLPPGKTLTLRFAPKPARAPAVEVTTEPDGACGGTVITVNGKPQPLLWDVGNRLATLISALLGNPYPAPARTTSLGSPP